MLFRPSRGWEYGKASTHSDMSGNLLNGSEGCLRKRLASWGETIISHGLQISI